MRRMIMKRMLRKLKYTLCLRKKLVTKAMKYNDIEDIVYGYNLDENIYNKYEKILRIIMRED
jgi:hypothetical protein